MRRLRDSADKRAWGPRAVRCRRIADRGPDATFSVALDATSGSTGVMNKLRIWLAAQEKRRRLDLTAGPFWQIEASGDARKRNGYSKEEWATTMMRFLMENSMMLTITIDG